MEDQKLIEVIERLKGIRTETKSKVSDEVLFDIAARIYTSEQIESHKSKWQGQKFIPFRNQGADAPVSTSVPATPAPTKQDIDMATPNQIAALKKMGYDKDTSKLTKYEAYLLIKGGKKSWKI